MKRYLFITHFDVEPGIEGPFKSPAERDTRAKKFRDENGPDHGIFALDIDVKGEPSTWAYPCSFFDKNK